MAYNQETADSIVELLETTPLKYICEQEGMPSRSEVYRWMDEKGVMHKRWFYRPISAQIAGHQEG